MLYEDVGHVQDHHIEALASYSGKAFQLIRLNGVVLAILVAAASNVEDISSFVNWFNVVGTGLLIVSTVTAVIPYRSSKVPVGIGIEGAKFTLQAKSKEVEYLDQSIRKRLERIGELEHKNSRKGVGVGISLLAFIVGLLLIIWGIVEGVGIGEIISMANS